MDAGARGLAAKHQRRGRRKSPGVHRRPRRRYSRPRPVWRRWWQVTRTAARVPAPRTVDLPAAAVAGRPAVTGQDPGGRSPGGARPAVEVAAEARRGHRGAASPHPPCRLGTTEAHRDLLQEALGLQRPGYFQVVVALCDDLVLGAQHLREQLLEIAEKHVKVPFRDVGLRTLGILEVQRLGEERLPLLLHASAPFVCVILGRPDGSRARQRRSHRRVSHLVGRSRHPRPAHRREGGRCPGAARPPPRSRTRPPSRARGTAACGRPRVPARPPIRVFYAFDHPGPGRGQARSVWASASGAWAPPPAAVGVRPVISTSRAPRANTFAFAPVPSTLREPFWRSEPWRESTVTKPRKRSSPVVQRTASARPRRLVIRNQRGHRRGGCRRSSRQPSYRVGREPPQNGTRPAAAVRASS